MLFQNNSIIAILGFVAFCTHCHIGKSAVGYGTIMKVVDIFFNATFILLIPHLLFCIYATICNYGYFQSLDIKEKFILACKSFFAGLVLTSIGACMVEFTAKMDFLYSHNEAIQIIKLLEFALTVFANISLLAYIIYKDIKAYLAKNKER